jgi:hypothetical protein
MLVDVVQSISSDLEGVQRRGGTYARNVRDLARREAKSESNYVEDIDEDESSNHENLELWHRDLLSENSCCVVDNLHITSVGPVVVASDVLSNLAIDTVILKSPAESHMALNPVDLKLDGKDSSIESEQHNGVKEKDPGTKEAKLSQTTLDARHGASDKDQDLEKVVADNLETSPLNGCLYR